LSFRRRVAFLVSIVTIVFPSIVFAASESQRPPVPGAAVGALIMWWICYHRRQQPIGGWLLYYFIQLYVAFAFALFITLISLENYRPSAWEGSNLYYLFLLSTVPGLIIEIAQVIVATGLLRVRDWRWVSYLKMVLVVHLVFVGIAIAIDAMYFQDSIVFDVLALIWPIIWLPYFSKSKRVERVFKTKDWLGQPVAAPA
jgi:hypothetical protein